MKRLKKVLLLLLAVSLIIGTTGCNLKSLNFFALKTPTPTASPTKEPYKSDPAGFVEFCRSTEPRYCYVSKSELLEYESLYADCNGTWFRDQLSGEDLIIYNSFLYALEHRFIYFSLYVEDSDKNFSYIREYLSLDSPFLEQNYSAYEGISKRPVNYIGEQIWVNMEQFTDSRWQMKLDALDKCRQIVENIPPEYETQQAKMEYLYDYVCDNVEYVMYETMIDESYFYDAVCKGQTVCDGYSNMLSLLFRLIGVECCEVMGYNGYGEAGHTWVAAKLNGTFYNFDPTFEDTNQLRSDGRKYFGFSDTLVSVDNFNYEQKRPKCTDTSRDFICADITVTNIAEKSEVKRIAEIAEQRLMSGHATTLIGVTSPVEPDFYNVFYDQFFTYAKKTKKISLSYLTMQNGAWIEITLTRR